MFVVDDLVGWLIGRLADAGYQKLATLVRGSDQARALKAAITAAVQATVADIGLSDPVEAEQAAEQINKAFRRREPVPLPPGQPILLEVLQAGIAERLWVVGDAGQRAGSLPGVPVSEVAAKLTGHLVRQIQIRGSQPGPLAPLADQLNHDLTHLQVQRLEGQGQRIEGMLAHVLDWLSEAVASPGATVGPAGQPLPDVRDPFALEVHRPVEPDVPQPKLPVLPVYVQREHDAALAEVVMAAAAGTSGIAVLVGGSSTGKTRACWQALDLLRGLEPMWRVWHPIDPSPPQAALAGLPGVAPRTVVWLNEAQNYLRSSDDAGERVAAGLRELLRDQPRGPVLVLATLWPDYWAELTVRPSGGADPHVQARELLAGHDIPVPGAFTDEQLRELARAKDPRLTQAADGSRDGQVIQYLAGAPELLGRYRIASPAARALMDAAMDAARLGMRGALPRAFLEAASPGYLTDTEWELLPGDWLERALDHTAAPAKGVRGPLAPIRPRPAPGVAASRATETAWQLADYLDQHGRRARRELIPPAAFWAAAASHADPADLTTLAQAAEYRGLYRDAARLYKHASARGDAVAAARLVRLLHNLHPGDQRAANWAVDHASLDDPRAVTDLLEALREAGAIGQVTALLGRDPAAHLSLDDPYHVAILLEALREAGANGQVAALLDRDPAAHTDLRDPRYMVRLLDELRRAGNNGQAAALASRAVDHADLDAPGGVAKLLDVLHEVGATAQVTALLDRDPATHVDLRDGRGVAKLLDVLHEVGDTGQVTALLDRHPATHVDLRDPYGVADLLGALHVAGGDTGQVTALLARDPAAHAWLEVPWGVAELLYALHVAGATDQVSTLASRAAAHADLNDPAGVAVLLSALHSAEAAAQVTALADSAAANADLRGVNMLLLMLRGVGTAAQVTALAARAAARADLDDPGSVSMLLYALHEVGATAQVSALLARDPATHVKLSNPGSVSMLLYALHEVGATAQVSALLARDPATHVDLGDEGDVARLLDALRKARARGQTAALIERLPAAGMFKLFLRQEGRGGQFRFGREADGRPAKRWTWTNLS